MIPIKYDLTFEVYKRRKSFSLVVLKTEHNIYTVEASMSLHEVSMEAQTSTEVSMSLHNDLHGASTDLRGGSMEVSMGAQWRSPWRLRGGLHGGSMQVSMRVSLETSMEVSMKCPMM